MKAKLSMVTATSAPAEPSGAAVVSAVSELQAATTRIKVKSSSDEGRVGSQ